MIGSGALTPVAGLVLDGAVGPLATRLGLSTRHALAARRQAEREESRGMLGPATDCWILALTIEPSHPGAWRGLARCVRLAGRPSEARMLERSAERLERAT